MSDTEHIVGAHAKDHKAAEVVTVTHVAGSKAAKAQEIFNEIGRTAPRKEVIARMQHETGLTAAGASTYYQNMKGKAGMVNKRVMVTMPVPQGQPVATIAKT